MEQKEFVRHPIYTNYEASRDGVIRHCRLKKTVGSLNKYGYFRFKISGNKNYLCHKFIYEVFHGVVKDGLVIHHINSDTRNNSLDNLQLTTQSQNCKVGNTGISPKTPKSVISTNIVTGEKIVFKSMNTAAIYFGICVPSVKRAADHICKSVYSIKYDQRIMFEYV